MADTRFQIKEIVELNVGRSNEALENVLCNEALKMALIVHPFTDAASVPSDFTLTEDATSVSIAATENIVDVISARIVEASGSLNTSLIMKNRFWWDKHIINPEDNQKGWPVYGMRAKSVIHFDRPLESGLELRLRLTTEQTFTNDNTECPIGVLDKFVIKYVTAQMFKQLKQFDVAKEWRAEALGPYFDGKSIPGGLLLSAISLDKADTAEEMQVSRSPISNGGTAILNNITGSDNYGNTEVWY